MLPLRKVPLRARNSNCLVLPSQAGLSIGGDFVPRVTVHHETLKKQVTI